MAINVDELRQSIHTLFCSINEKTPETILRSYINRSYYVIYHECKHYIETHLTQYNLSDVGTFKTGTHKRIYFVFEDMSKTNKQAHALAIKFNDFLDKRHRADYNLSDRIDYFDYIQCKKYFETIPTLLKNLS